MSELKPCPFCNGEAGHPEEFNNTFIDYKLMRVWCTNKECGVYTLNYRYLENAIKAWNIRATVPECHRCDRIEKWLDHYGTSPNKLQKYEKLLAFVKKIAAKLPPARELLKEIGESNG